MTHRARVKRPTTIHFGLSKYSHVGIVVLRGSQTVYLTSASFPYGMQGFAVPAFTQPGPYTIRLAATDLAGNVGASSGVLSVTMDTVAPIAPVATTGSLTQLAGKGEAGAAAGSPAWRDVGNAAG